jgi:hypothetical protein
MSGNWQVGFLTAKHTNWDGVCREKTQEAQKPGKRDFNREIRENEGVAQKGAKGAQPEATDMQSRQDVSAPVGGRREGGSPAS